MYWTDDGQPAALRYNNWKITFLKQNAVGIDVWRQAYEELRAPMITNLRMDPFERAEFTIGYNHWWVDHMYMFAPGAAYVGQWLESFKEFPPRMKPGSFSLGQVMDKLTSPQGNK
jgi:arylsulfatase